MNYLMVVFAFLIGLAVLFAAFSVGMSIIIKFKRFGSTGGIRVFPRITSFKLFMVSLVLFILTAPVNIMMVREIYASNYVENRYEIAFVGRHTDPITQTEVNDIGRRDIQLGSSTLSFKDTPTGAFKQSEPGRVNEPAKEIFQVDIFLNGKKITSPGKVVLGNELGKTHYLGYIDLFKVKDKETNQIETVLIQTQYRTRNIPDESYRWKIIHIQEDGTYREEQMTYSEKSQHWLYVRLINLGYLFPMMFGYYSNMMLGYPSIIFPFLYPWLFNTLMIVLLFIAVIMKFKKKVN